MSMTKSKQLSNKPMSVEFTSWNHGGEFGIVSKHPVANTLTHQVLNTYTCRETFATQWGRAVRNGSDKMSLTASTKNRKKIVKFFEKLEDKLELKVRTTFHYIANRSTGLIIEPSKWWLRSAMRRSIFTIFLRAGKHYKSNFDAAIQSQQYFQRTKNAVNRFLDGHTYYRGRSGGWVNVFNYAGKAKVKQQLKSEAERQPRVPIFGKQIDITFHSLSRAETGNYAPLKLDKRKPPTRHRTEYWSYCREKMDGRKWTSIVFCHKRSEGKHVAAFIRRIEKKLQIPKLSTCGPTNRKGIMWIKVSPFWRSTKMRKSFFTALLRASLVYNPNKFGTWTKALTKTKYFKPTAFAVKRFLQGYTGWNGSLSLSRAGRTKRRPYRRRSKSFSGWVDEFADDIRNNEDVKQMLKKVVI